ncbi:MAG TPA: hypothetical protein VKU19_30185 [Bryobacteraceae bacterium]|nr:hypothetical protein [Bryobacteraceae bacterium]
MPMVPFAQRFPKLGPAETKSVKVLSGDDDLPAGDYGFIDFYCDEKGCDCRRAMIVVLRPETAWNKLWATISYGWETKEFYQNWLPHGDPAELQGPTLDPLAPQSELSPALLELFCRIVLPSPGYIDRLKRHYQMFRETVDRPGGDRMLQEANRLQRRRVKHRDPRRRAKR